MGSESETVSDPISGGILAPFWVHFGPILDQKSSKMASGAHLGALGTPLENDSDFESPSRGAPAAVDVAPA